MVLGTLARHGQQHGHQIRRIAEITNVGEWGGVSVGALYRELRGLEAEGLVFAVRTEQVGRRPARTVYEITREGRLELGMLRERAITVLHYGSDPLGVALAFAGTGGDREELAGWLQGRREMLAIAAGQIRADRERLTARGHVDPVEATVMRRGELLAEAEVRWHDEFAKVLAGLPDEALAAGAAAREPAVQSARGPIMQSAGEPPAPGAGELAAHPS
jgi:DNA-binding PadR family transcriptional regulator